MTGEGDTEVGRQEGRKEKGEKKETKGKTMEKRAN